MKAIISINCDNASELIGGLEHILDHVRRNHKRIAEVTTAEILYGFNDNNCGGDVDIEVYGETIHLTANELQEKLKELYDIDYPLFILKGTDKLSAQAIDGYLQLCVKEGCNASFMDKVNNKLMGFEDWQDTNSDLVKLPD